MRYVVRARDDDVVERPERQRAEHRVQRAAAVVDEEDLVGGGVAVQFLSAATPAGSASRITSSLTSSGTRPVIGSPAVGILPLLR